MESPRSELGKFHMQNLCFMTAASKMLQQKNLSLSVILCVPDHAQRNVFLILLLSLVGASSAQKDVN